MDINRRFGSGALDATGWIAPVPAETDGVDVTGWIPRVDARWSSER